MAEPIKFTELTNAGVLNLSAIMAIVQEQAGELVSLQCSMAQVAELVAQGAEYNELTTEHKTIIAAINEIAAGGGGGGAYFFNAGEATADQIREKYNNGLMCFLVASDGTIYPLTAVDSEYIQSELVEGVFFAKAFGYDGNINVTIKYIEDDAGTEVKSLNFTGVSKSQITNNMSETNGKIPTDNAVRSYVTNYITGQLNAKADTSLENINEAGEQKIRDIAGGGGSGVDPVARAGVEEVKADLSELPKDVQINGTSILDENKVANIPVASTSAKGVVSINASRGVGAVASDSSLFINKATDVAIDARDSLYLPIVPRNLDYAVKQAMCDGKGAEWTEAEKANARARMGVGDYELIADVTLEENTSVFEVEYGGNKEEILVHVFLPYYGSGIANDAIQISLFQNDTRKTRHLLSYVQSSDSNYWFEYELKIFENSPLTARRVVGYWSESHHSSFTVTAGSNQGGAYGIYHQPQQTNYKFVGVRVAHPTVPKGTRVIIIGK